MHYERVSLARRGGSWRMSYRAVYDAERKGDRKWATIGAAASRAEAEHLAAEYLYNLPRDPEDERRAEAIEATEGRMPTVGELRRDDIDHALAVGAIEKSTHAGYCRHVRLLGDLGEIPVDRVTAQDVQLYVDSLVEDGYCSETVNHMLWTVRDTLELASFRMLRPPLDLRRIRAPKHDRPLPRALSAEEKNALLAALPCIRGPLDAIVRLALFAGLRCGEICALRWANVDLNRRMVRITSAIGTLPSSNGYLKGPKSPAGVRALPIADGLMEGLERRRAEQEARCRDAGVPFTDDIFVVGDIDGAFMVPRYANQLFRTFVRTFGIGGGKAVRGIGAEIGDAPVLEPAREPVARDVARWVGRHKGGMRRIEDVGLAGHGLAVMVPGELGDLVVAAHEGEPRELGLPAVHHLAPIVA